MAKNCVYRSRIMMLLMMLISNNNPGIIYMKVCCRAEFCFILITTYFLFHFSCSGHKIVIGDASIARMSSGLAEKNCLHSFHDVWVLLQVGLNNVL